MCSALEEYHECIGGVQHCGGLLLVHWEDIVICVGDIMGALGCAQCIGE